MNPWRLFPLLFLLSQARVFSQATWYSITEFGALGDGTTLNTVFIQRAIDRCASAGGGMVEVPPGVFLTGTVQLRSHVNLHVQTGGVLKGSRALEDYMLNGKRVGLLFTENAEDVAITGEGTIDGSGDAFMIAGRSKKIDSAGSAWTRQKSRFREVTMGMDDGPSVPLDRPYQMIIFSNCRRVTLRGVTIVNSPFWTVHCADCDGVIVSGVRIWCDLRVPNNDGIDFTSCSNIQMSDCDIRTGDDCIVLTGYDHHFDLPGFQGMKHPSENATITNCTLQSRSAAIRIGGFDQNPMRNYVFSNITITNSNRGIGLFARDRGSIENMLFSNIVIDTRLHTGDWWGQGDPIHLSAVRLLKDVAPGTIRNVKFQHILCKGESGIVVYGTKESVIEGVSFEDVALELRNSPLQDVAGGNFDLRPVLDPRLQIFAHDIPGLYAGYVSNLRLRDFAIRWEGQMPAFFSDGIEVEHFRDVSIEGFSGVASPANPRAYPILLRQGKGIKTDAPQRSMHLEQAEK